jgi:hypothetical protein
MSEPKREQWEHSIRCPRHWRRPTPDSICSESPVERFGERIGLETHFPEASLSRGRQRCFDQGAPDALSLDLRSNPCVFPHHGHRVLQGRSIAAGLRCMERMLSAC